MHLKVSKWVRAEEESIVEFDGSSEIGARHDCAYAGYRVSIVDLKVH